MNALKYILGFYLMAMPISEVQPFYTQSNSKNNIEQTELKNNSTFTLKKVSKCTQNTNFEYTNPFTALKRKGTMSSEGTNSKLNTNTINITKKTVLSGLVLFNHEDSIREKYAKLIGFDIDWRFIHNAPYSSKIRDSVIKEFTQQNSYLTAKQGILQFLWQAKYEYNSTDDKIYLATRANYLTELNYFGSGIAIKKIKEAYNPSLAKEFRKRRLKPTDCITFVLRSYSFAKGKNFVLTKYNTFSKFSKFLEKNGYEAIYVAENTKKTDDKYKYDDGARTNNLVKKIMPYVNKNKYVVPLDYVVTDKGFKSQAFKEFLNENYGFVFLQDGFHTGMLNKGNFLEAKQSANPLIDEVFSNDSLYDLLDNDDPWTDYQSAVIVVPKGTVKTFIEKNKNKFTK